jgi:carboxyl-terminal processing protease
VNLTSPTALSIMGTMMLNSQASCRRTKHQLNTLLRPLKTVPDGIRRGLLCAALALVVIAGSVYPAGANVFSTPELTCGRSYDLVKSLLKRHISFRELNPELRERAIKSYIERIDPSKTLFLSSEVDVLRLRLRGVFFGMQNGECELLEQLHTDLIGRYERMEKQVRELLSSEDYALDTDVRLILDSDKRGHPEDEEGREQLVERLVHFQMSNYLSGDMELDKAKEKLIHRYELMTKRITELEPRDTYGIFLNAFASALDPHSTYYPPEAVEDFEIQMSLSLDGIGVALSSRDGYSIVERIIPGGATDKADALEPGDKIIAVAQGDEEPVDIIDMSLRDVVSIIRGKRGSTVKLTVLRKSDTTERLEVEIVRDKVTIEDAAATLEFREIEIGDETKKLAILDLPTFYGDSDPAKRQSGRDVRDLLRQVRDAKADGLLLDLSRNGGGKLESSVEIAGLFIREGGIVAVKNVFAEVQVLEDQDEDIIYDGPLVILTSRLTASASEIVAGAMKDYGRAVIVGDDHTFGKGTVQSFVHQPGRLGAIKVTTALFFRPGGASTQHEGVAADIVLPSIFATDDLGERYTPYSLASQMIPPFLGASATLTSSSNPKQDYPQLSDEMVFELRQRSAARVEESAEFTEIKELLAKQAEEDDVVHLAELIRERESAEDDTSGDANDSEEAVDGVDGLDTESTDKTGDADEGSSNSESESDSEDTNSEHSGDEAETSEDAAKPYTEEEPEPTPQREEAIRILADLVELQESVESPWHVPQSASRSEQPSSQP